MLPAKIKATVPVCLLAVLVGASAWAETSWIRAGSYIDWPDTLQGDPSDMDGLFDAAAPVSYEQPELLFPDEPGSPIAVAPQAPLSSGYAPMEYWGWQILPQGLLYHSYLAGEKEPRFASQWLWDRERGRIWEAAIGGRFGLLRKGTLGIDGEGFQFDVEGASLVRIDPEEESDLEAADFRAGFLGTWRYGRWRYKAGYYHISSHIGDEYLIKNIGFRRINYVRDALIVGTMYDVTPDFQLYGEVANALNANGGAEPWEFQFGAQYAPAFPTGKRGAPFAAINGHLREEFNYGGSVNVEAGWAWRGGLSNHLFRVGLQHYNGPSIQYSLLRRYENMTGLGIWFDF